MLKKEFKMNWKRIDSELELELNFSKKKIEFELEWELLQNFWDELELRTFKTNYTSLISINNVIFEIKHFN